MLKVYDAQGQLVRRLVEARQQGGSYCVVWDGRDERGGRAASGAYFAELNWDGRVVTEKMLLLK